MFKFSLKRGEIAEKAFWSTTPQNPYSITMLDRIDDGNSSEASVSVTSIPSPFAQMQLIETAFNFVRRSEDLEGDSIYHKLVSDCLDVYEIMYRIDELGLRSNISMNIWTLKDLEEMKDQFATSGQQNFAKTIELFIERYNRGNDDEPFNQMYIISYKGTPIAGTSPYTGFFTTANKIEAKINYYESRTFFDNDNPTPLHLRNADFRVFMTLFIRANRLTDKFKELNNYLIASNVANVDEDLTTELSPVSSNIGVYENYKAVNFDNNPLYIYPNIAFKIPQSDSEEDTSEELFASSDYRVHSTKELENPPLILKKGIRNTQWNYLTGPIPEDLDIPAKINQEYELRIPPMANTAYPFIIESDILSEFIVELNYPIYSDKFITCLSGSKDFKKGYLLPIKPDYFKFFTLKDLEKNLKISVETSKTGNTYNLELKMPLRANENSGEIVFSKKYITLSNPENRIDNEGIVIKEKSEGLGLFMGFYPFYKIGKRDEKSDVFMADQTHGIYNDFYKTFVYYNDNLEVKCDFYQIQPNCAISNLPVSEKNYYHQRTEKRDGRHHISDYYELSNNLDNSDRDITYDFIQLKIKKEGFKETITALVIPQMKMVELMNSGDEPYLSFDIGTTNTFVGISTKKTDTQPFSTEMVVDGQKEFQMTMLNAPVLSDEYIKQSSKYEFNQIVGNADYGQMLYNEFMPTIIRENTKYSFPISTAIAWKRGDDLSDYKNIGILSTVNIPFTFGINALREIDSVQTNLKWEVDKTKSQEAENQLKAFIEQLIIMGRNRFISEGYNPSKIKLIWFKPLSMSIGQSSLFITIWEELYLKYYTKSRKAESKLKMISESAAPFHVLKKDDGGKSFLNIDVGGGTSDFVYYSGEKIALSSSIRFAGDALFSEGLNPLKNRKDNGFVKKYAHNSEASIVQILENQNDKRSSVLEELITSGNFKSQDVINFLFTIKEFPDKLRRDDEFKMLLLLHHSAIIYHSAQLLNGAKCAPPRDIGLSGNGSRLFGITNITDDLNNLSNLATIIYRKIFGDDLKLDIAFARVENPKEATAYGGIKGYDLADEDARNSYTIDLGNGQNPLEYKKLKNKYSYQDIYDGNVKLDNEQELLLNAVAENVIEFFRFFFDELWVEADIMDTYGVNESIRPEKVKEYVSNKVNIINLISSGVKYKINAKETRMSETLFFYPIIHYLYELSKIAANGNNEFK